MMLRAVSVVVLLALALSGCDRKAGPEPQPQITPLSTLDYPVDPRAVSTELPPPPATGGAEEEEDLVIAPPENGLGVDRHAPPPPRLRDPGPVMAAWASAVEARNWRAVRAFWGENGSMSGLTPRAFEKLWDALQVPKVTLGPGQQEAGAGSLFYVVPVTIADGPRRVTGQVVLRRVNDVPGASGEQLRWHIERSTLQPGVVVAPPGPQTLPGTPRR